MHLKSGALSWHHLLRLVNLLAWSDLLLQKLVLKKLLLLLVVEEEGGLHRGSTSVLVEARPLSVVWIHRLRFLFSLKV